MNEPGRSAEFDFRAERAFPMTVVAGHGLLAGTAVTLLLLPCRLGGLGFSGLAATRFPGWWPLALPAGGG